MEAGASKKNAKENVSVGDICIYSAEESGRDSTSLSQPRGEEGASQNQPVSVHNQENDTTTTHKDDVNAESEHTKPKKENEGQYGRGQTPMNDTGDELDEKQEEELKGEQEGEKKETDDNEEEEENGDDLPVDSSDDSDSDSSMSETEVKEEKLVEIIVAMRKDMSSFFTQTATMVQKNDDGIYADEFMRRVWKIATLHADDCMKPFPVNLKQAFMIKMGEDLVESGSVPILCQVSADVLETQRYLSDDEEERQNHRRMIHAALLALCNYTDISRAVTKAVKEHGVLVPVLLDKLSEWRAQYLDGTLNDSKELVHHLLGILHNMAMQEENVEYFRDLKTSEVLWDYLLATDDDIRVMSLATLADISTDAESGRLTTSSDLVKFVLNLLRETLGSADHTYNGWRGAEIVRAVRQLARNDVNKKLLVDDGVLPLLVQGVDSVLEDEKVESMEALWRLSFSKDNKARFVENEELMDLVRKVFYDRKEKDSCRVAAQGILEQVGCQLSKTLDSVPNV